MNSIDIVIAEGVAAEQGIGNTRQGSTRQGSTRQRQILSKVEESTN